jgi:FkbM family methyltransferase
MDYEYGFDLPGSATVIVDAGANIGLSTLYFKHIFPEAKVVALEPDPSNFHMLQLNTGNERGVVPYQAAIWNANLKLGFVNDTLAEKWAIRVDEADRAGHATTEGIDVVSMMDKFQLSHIDIFKIDIEGSEMELFSKDVSGWISKVKIIVIELHESLRPGCTEVFHNALKSIPHSLHYHDENVIVRNLLYS